MIFKLLGSAAVLIVVLLAVGRVPLGYTLRNLTVRWKTTLLTALAFTLVISLLVVMLAFVNGMSKLTLNTGRPDNVMVLAEGSTDEAFSNLEMSDAPLLESARRVLRDENNRPVASRETFMIVNQPIRDPVPGRPTRRFLQLRGIDDPLLAGRVHDVELFPGGAWFSNAGVSEMDAKAQSQTAIQAVLGEGVARELSHDRTPERQTAARDRERLDVGELFTLGNRTWIVTGILRSSGSTFNSEIWAKRSLVAAIFGKQTYTTLVLRARSSNDARELQNFLNDKNANTQTQVTAQVETDYYASLSQTNKQFLFAIVFVAAVMSIGGVFGVMNTMFAAINQRIHDIGVLRLLGFSRLHILVTVVLESMLIAMIGGLAGCALGYMADGWTATSVVSGHEGGGKFVVLKLVVDLDILSAGVLVTLAMGLFGGLLPAWSAMRMRPLEALR